MTRIAVPKEKIQTALVAAICFFLYVRIPADISSEQSYTGVATIDALARNSLIFAVVGIFALLMLHASYQRRLTPPVVLWPYLLALLFYAVRVLDGTQFVSSIASVLVVLMFFGIAGKSRDLSSEIRRLHSVELGFRWFFLSVLATSILLYANNLGYHREGFRFAGLSYHPNQFGLVCALSLIFFWSECLGDRRLRRSVAVAGAVASLFFVIASGSRGGLLAAATGCLALFYNRRTTLSGVLATFTLVLAGSWLFLSYGVNQDLILARIQENEFNRIGVFSTMLDGFLSAPFFGAGTDAIGSESSILKALAIGGILCGIPLLIFFLMGCSATIGRLWVRRYPDQIMLKFDAIVLSIMVASMLDGYLFERLGLVAFILISIFSASALSKARRFNSSWHA